MKTNFKRSLLSFAIMFGTTVTFAQSAIHGTVKDSNGEPLVGVSIQANDGSGTVTDVDGNFSVNARIGDMLKISYVGYVSMQVKAASSLDIILKEENLTLNEVVAIGYGTVKKTDLTGSLSQVKAKDLTAVTASNLIQGLQGRVTGLAVTTDNRPGKSPTLRIRGNGSISASNSPLFVVDGFPMMNASMSELNVNDIESIEVLKDASSTAIYGSRGSNGVIMITTKSGAKSQKNLTLNANFGIQSPGRKIGMMAHDQFVDYINYYYQNKTGKSIYNDAYPAPDTDTDWEDALIHSGKLVQDYNVTLDGTSGDTQYLMSGGFFLQDGLLSGSTFDKYTFRTNLNHKFNKLIELGTHLQYSYAKSNMAEPVAGEGLTSIWRTGWNTLPFCHEDGTVSVPNDYPQIAPYFGNAREWNPVYNYTQQTDQSSVSRLFGDVYLNLNILKGLTFKTNIGIDMANQRDYNYITSKDTNATGSGKGGQGFIRQLSRITENILTYQNQWGDHRFSATGVYSWQDYTYENLTMSGSGFANDETGAWDMSVANRETLAYGSTKYDNTLISWTARTTYAYKDRYMLTATARWDGSSRFGANNKWGFFPSLGMAWRASEEEFLKDNHVVTNLKVRASVGVTGNQEIGNYKSLAQLKAQNYIYKDGEIKGFYETIANKDLKWERANQLDFGLDLSFFDRLHITADYYYRRTSDLLYEVPIPSTSGFSAMLTNVGSVQNKGIELSVVGNIIRSKDLNANLTLNFSRNRNKITRLYGDVESVTLSSSLDLSRYLKVGEALNTRYALVSDGIITTQEQLAAYQKIESTAKLGDERYKDLDGDNSITVKDEVNIGTSDPKFFYGVGLDLQYKTWSLNILGNGAHDFVGGTSYLVVAENQLEGAQGIPSRWAYERMWTPTNTSGTLPSPGANNIHLSDRICKGWYYFVVKSISLMHDFGQQHVKGLGGIKGISAGVNFENFITFANHRGYNPENGDTSYPWIRTVNLSLKVKF